MLLSSFLPRGTVPLGQMLITENEVLSFPNNVMAVVVLVGAGGSGGAVNRHKNADLSKIHGQGGNAGGTAIQLIRMLAGESYTFTIGVGGAAAGSALVNTTTVGTYAGTDGTDTTLTSTVTGFGTITANGGDGGIAWYLSSVGNADTTTHNHQTQTWGSNASLILPGGYGGAIILNDTHDAGMARGIATGGGAVNFSGAPADAICGGDFGFDDFTAFSWDPSDAANVMFATGGGGIGGNGGAIEYYDAAWWQSQATHGGGSMMKTRRLALWSYTSGQDGGDKAQDNPFVTGAALAGCTGAAGSGVHVNGTGIVGGDGGPGAGGGAACESNDNNGAGDIQAGHGGIFGGGGGAQGDNRVQAPAGLNDVTGGDGGLGAGGGAACSSAAVEDPTRLGSDVWSGAGGNGFAVVYLLTDFGQVKT